MAINRVTYPTTPTPASGDWALLVNLMLTNYLKNENTLRIDYVNDNVLKGAVFHIGGTIYLADSDTAITGTPSAYVKITPSGATASAAYVANLTGVTWRDTYNGYYDVSGNLYVFDEQKAFLSAVILSTKTIERSNIPGYFVKGFISLDLTNFASTTAPQIVAGSVVDINGVIYKNDSAVSITGSVSNSTWYDILLTPSGSTFTASYVARGTGTWSELKGGLYSGNNRVIGCLYINGSGQYINKNILIVNNRHVNLVIRIGDWNMDSTGGINIDVWVDQANWRNLNVQIISDIPSAGPGAANSQINLDKDGTVYHSLTQADNILSLARETSGIFDSASYDSTSYNRGWIYITYEV